MVQVSSAYDPKNHKNYNLCGMLKWFESLLENENNKNIDEKRMSKTFAITLVYHYILYSLQKYVMVAMRSTWLHFASI